MALSRLSRDETRYTLLHLIDFCELQIPSMWPQPCYWSWREHIILISWCISERLRRGSFLHVDISSRFSEGRSEASYSSHRNSIKRNAREGRRHSSFD